MVLHTMRGGSLPSRATEKIVYLYMKNFSGDSDILKKIIFFIMKKGWELDGTPIHTGKNVYEIPFIKEPAGFLSGVGYKGKFWIENEEIQYKEKVTWMS